MKAQSITQREMVRSVPVILAAQRKRYELRKERDKVLAEWDKKIYTEQDKIDSHNRHIIERGAQGEYFIQCTDPDGNEKTFRVILDKGEKVLSIKPIDIANEEGVS